MKLYAITLLNKETQFSKAAREDSYFPTTFVLARSTKEARKRAVSLMDNINDRIAVTEVGPATVYFNKIRESADLS